MKLDPTQFYNGYRSTLKGQINYCTMRWVEHFYKQLIEEGKE